MIQVYIVLSLALTSAERESLLVAKERGKCQDENHVWLHDRVPCFFRCESYHSLRRVSKHSKVRKLSPGCR